MNLDMIRYVKPKSVLFEGSIVEVEKHDSYISLCTLDNGNLASDGHIFVFGGWVLDDDHNRTEQEVVWGVLNGKQIFSEQLVMDLDEWITYRYVNVVSTVLPETRVAA